MDQQNTTLREEKPITLKTCISYGLGDIGDNVCFSAIGSLLTIFYTDYIGVPAATVALIMLLSRFLDGISDFICGIVIDRTKSKWGKARPWVLWMSLPFSLAVVACFTVPKGSSLMQAVYIFIMYNFLNTFAYTFSNLAQSTMNSLMTRDPAMREKLSTWRCGMAPIAHILAGGMTMPMVVKFGDNQRAWVIVMGIWAIMSLVCHLICFFNCEEQVHIEAQENAEKVPLGKSLKALVVNKYWWWALAFWVFWATSFGINGTTMSYFTKYTLHDSGTLYSQLFILEKVVYMFAIIVLVPFLRKRGFSTIKLMAAGYVLGIIGHLLLLINPTSMTINYITVLLRAFCLAPSSALFFSLVANVVEYGQYKTHIRQESMVYSCSSVAMKAGGGIITAVLTMMYSISGYISSAGGNVVQPDSALSMITTLYIWAPIIIFGVLLVASLCYRLDGQMPAIMEELKAREARGEL